MKQQEQYLKELLEVGRKEKVNELELARIFHNAYDRHKKIYGSNKFKTEDYGEEMDKRYKFMYQKGLEYITTTKMERKYGLSDVNYINKFEKEYGPICGYLRQPIRVESSKIYGKCALTKKSCEKDITTKLKCDIAEKV